MTHNTYSIYVPSDITRSETQQIIEKTINWFIEKEIIEDKKTNCLAKGGMGYPPGPKAMNYMEDYATSSNFLDYRINGLEIIHQRQAFSNNDKVFKITCPECNHDIDFEENNCWEPAYEEWLLVKGKGNFTCQRCGHTTPLKNYHWSPNWAFGEVGFKFWNWPRFTKQFNTYLDFVWEGRGFELIVSNDS